MTGELQNFQTLSNRARKDVNLSDIKVRVAVFAFDLMYLNGQVNVFFFDQSPLAYTRIIVFTYGTISTTTRVNEKIPPTFYI